MPTSSLSGLVLAGGASRRMARDKGALRYHGEPQVVHAVRLLSPLVNRVYVSVNARQADLALYADLPLIVDEGAERGPAAGLEAAWARHPHAAWLTLAVDMPLVDRTLLEELIAARDPGTVATAFRNRDGVVEPLCTIWEPAARPLLLAQVRAGDGSLRRFLERGGATLIEPTSPERLRGANDPAERAAVAARLADARSDAPIGD